MSKSKQQFMLALFEDSKYAIINGTAIRVLDNGNVVKISLSTGNTFGEYDRLIVGIVNVKNAKIDRESFIFDDNLTHDETNTHANANVKHKLQVISHVKWDWYINIPTRNSVDLMIKTIDKYVEFFSG